MTSETLRHEAERLAQRFHETYERLAPSFGYETRPASAVAWTNAPDPNRSLMTATCAELLRDSFLLDNAHARALLDALDQLLGQPLAHPVPGLGDAKERLRSGLARAPAAALGPELARGSCIVVDGVLTCFTARHGPGPCGVCSACRNAADPALQIGFHDAWGAAKDSPGYTKAQWVAAQRAVERRGIEAARHTPADWRVQVAELASLINEDNLASEFAATLFEAFAQALADGLRINVAGSERAAMIVAVRELVRCGRIDLAALCSPRGDSLDTAIHVANRLLDHWVRHPAKPGDSAASILSAVLRLVDRGEFDLEGFCPPGPAGDDEPPPLDGPPPPGYVDATRETITRMAIDRANRRQHTGDDQIRASLRIDLYADDVLVAEVRDRDEWLRLLAQECTPNHRRTHDT